MVRYGYLYTGTKFRDITRALIKRPSISLLIPGLQELCRRPSGGK